MNELKESVDRDLQNLKSQKPQRKGKQKLYRRFGLNIKDRCISSMCITYKSSSKAQNWIRTIQFSLDANHEIEATLWTASEKPSWFHLPSDLEVGQLLGVGNRFEEGFFREKYLIVSRIRQNSMCLDEIAEFKPSFDKKSLLKAWQDWESVNIENVSEDLDEEYRARLARER